VSAYRHINIDKIGARNIILTLQKDERFWGGKRVKIHWDTSILIFLKTRVNHFAKKGGGWREDILVKS